MNLHWGIGRYLITKRVRKSHIVCLLLGQQNNRTYLPLGHADLRLIHREVFKNGFASEERLVKMGRRSVNLNAFIDIFLEKTSF